MSKTWRPTIVARSGPSTVGCSRRTSATPRHAASSNGTSPLTNQSTAVRLVVLVRDEAVHRHRLYMTTLPTGRQGAGVGERDVALKILEHQRQTRRRARRTSFFVVERRSQLTPIGEDDHDLRGVGPSDECRMVDVGFLDSVYVAFSSSRRRRRRSSGHRRMIVWDRWARRDRIEAGCAISTNTSTGPHVGSPARPAAVRTPGRFAPPLRGVEPASRCARVVGPSVVIVAGARGTDPARRCPWLSRRLPAPASSARRLGLNRSDRGARRSANMMMP